MNITIGKDVCINTEQALRREWLDTNGLGGYASSTIIDCHTRKYHGLLVASLPGPHERTVLLSKMEASIHLDRQTFRLSTNKYPGVFYPTGHKYIERFEYALYPKTTYRIGDILFEKSLVLVRGRNTVLLRYHFLESTLPVLMRIKPLLAYRDFHALQKENMFIQVKTYFEKNGFKIEPYQGMPPLTCVSSKKTQFYPSPEWYYSVEYHKERRRGYPYQEDLFSPGIFEVTLSQGEDIFFGASVDTISGTSLEKMFNEETDRRSREFENFPDSNAVQKFRKYSAGQFFITRPSGDPSLVAGYHWFGEWGRDTMIALPGLAFCTGRLDEGAAVLRTFAGNIRDGLIPNFLGKNGDHATNSADASLWFFWAVQQYLLYGGDQKAAVVNFLPALRSIIHSVLDGTNPHIRLRGDGMVETGSPDTQLTWMDALVNGAPVTPRHGCAVEINALWFNALRFYSGLCTQSGEECTREETVADACAASFPETFWNDRCACLYDVVRGDEKDASIRPNQIFAVSLPHSMLPPNKARAVVSKALEELVTPYGLRTLSPGDSRYESVYEGGPDSRDAAYHQGTVWPWLLGHFTEACLKTSNDPEGTRRFLREKFEPVLEHFPRDFGLHTVPEIYNGSPPYKPKGCISQAWSHGELIRMAHLLEEEGIK
ncbi:MAG: amylo-alpha-1,6-glucosidase [Acidobacteriota bacterium]